MISAPGAGETPTLYVDGEKVAASYDPVTGTLTPTTPLADGSHQLTYTLTDAAGNESAQSPALTVTVDTLAPATPAVPSIWTMLALIKESRGQEAAQMIRHQVL